MTITEAVAYLENESYNAPKTNLDRMRELLRRMGDPQKELRFIHVAGTNGKGSACAMFASVLKYAGYKVGLYTSPYLCEFNERLQINNRNIPDDKLIALVERLAPIADGMDPHPTWFEMVTALSFWYYLEEKCDIVVLEVGMGGLTDATNTIPCPEVAVLMNMGLEHTEYLGDTLEKIAANKAGIIKSGGDAVCYWVSESVEDVYKEKCAAVGAALHSVDFSAIEPISRGLDGQRFRFGDFGELNLSLLGDHQLRNAATVLTAIEVLRKKGWSISNEAVREGLANTHWTARFEVLSQSPLFVVDGGHNPQCAKAMADLVAEYMPGQKITFMVGALAYKDYTQMLDLIWPYAAQFYCVTPESDRALPASEMAALIRQRGGVAEDCGTVAEGVERVIREGCDTLCFGSLYMVGWARRYYLEKTGREIL